MTAPSFVYFIQRGARGDIKIGYSANPGRRLAALQTGCPEALQLIATLPGSTRTEHELHRRFASLHVNGEWFRPGAGIFLYIAEQIARRATGDDVFAEKSRPPPPKSFVLEGDPLAMQARMARENLAAMKAAGKAGGVEAVRALQVPMWRDGA